MEGWGRPVESASFNWTKNKARISDQVCKPASQAAEAQEVALDHDAVHVSLKDDDASIQRMFTPERLVHIAKSEAEFEAGLSYVATS